MKHKIPGMYKKLSKILVTGGAGFIGSEFVRQGVGKGYQIIVVDKLTYAGDLARLKEVWGKFRFYKTDICRKEKLEAIFKKERPSLVVHFAAETHVDRSIHDATPFIETNVKGTQVLLDLSRKYGIDKFLQLSTDEVYGEIRRGQFLETSPLAPNSPYAASKAAADLLIKSYIRTYDFCAIIVRPCNNYGPWQYPEKLVPVVILKSLKNQKVPVYAKGQNVREWLHVSDCIKAIFLILKKGKRGGTYNIGSGQERKNTDTVKCLLRYLRKSQSLIHYVKDRPGHDYRYSLCCSKTRALGWRPAVDFKKGMAEAASWNKQHLAWLESKLKYLAAYWKKVYKDP